MQDINSKYFSRCSMWRWHGEDCIDIDDEKGATVATLNQWETMVFYYAEGINTVGGFTSRLPTHYPDPERLPSDLGPLIVKNVRELAFRGFVNLEDEARSLDDKFDEPWDGSNTVP
jgi:hypothetical protein